MAPRKWMIVATWNVANVVAVVVGGGGGAEQHSCANESPNIE